MTCRKAMVFLMQLYGGMTNLHRNHEAPLFHVRKLFSYSYNRI